MSPPSDGNHFPRCGPLLTRRQMAHGMIAAAACVALPRPAVAQIRRTERLALAQTADAFLQALTPEKRQRAVFAFESPERFNWHYIPRRRAGLALKDMTADERTAAHKLLRVGLSTVGYRKVLDIMRLEEVLRGLEFFPFSRDPENYAFTVFGTPGSALPWGWRVEGHHLSLNFTVVADKHVAVTPAFMGANPAEVPAGSFKGLRVLAGRQDLARQLVQHLEPAQHGEMLIGTQSLGDIVSGPGRDDSLKSPAGLPLAAMNQAGRDLAVRLIEAYARDMRDEFAAVELTRIHEAGIEKIHFAWAGGLEPGQAHYYRLHGPTLLIEYDNTQNDASHIHSVWRDLSNDFGADLLRLHYETGHHRRQ
jgi:hypothetical protein